jgi:hypothetical protein
MNAVDDVQVVIASSWKNFVASVGARREATSRQLMRFKEAVEDNRLAPSTG